MRHELCRDLRYVRTIHDIELWLADTDRTPTDRDWSVLDDAERSRARRFRFVVDRDRYVVAHSTVRIVLGERLGQSAEDVRISTESEKPGLLDNPLHFNLSRSGGMVLVGMADEPIGVDIEQIRTEVADRATAEVVFAPSELVALGDPADAAIFFRIWTAKEAYVKAVGSGLTDAVRDIVAWPQAPSGWQTEELDVGPGYRAAVTAPVGDWIAVVRAFHHVPS